MGALASNAVVVVGEHVDELVAIEAADAVQNIGGHLSPTAARNTGSRFQAAEWLRRPPASCDVAHNRSDEGIGSGVTLQPLATSLKFESCPTSALLSAKR